MAVIRGAVVTVGQIAFYEQVKQMLLTTSYFKDNIVTHFSSSFVAGKINRLVLIVSCLKKNVLIIFNIL
jgi:hypothetical protein